MPERVRGLETYLNTVVDHGLNASTFTARVITSTGSDLVSAVVGALGALKGPLHGGAPGPALDMVFEIGDASRAEDVLRAKIEAGEKLMGFGHRVYKVRDPRADVLAAAAERMFTRGRRHVALHAGARRSKPTAIRLLEEYKPGRRLQTNVEFYTALLLHGLGLDVAAVHADVRDQPRERLDRARLRAAAREPHHPSAVRVLRAARPTVGAAGGPRCSRGRAKPSLVLSVARTTIAVHGCRRAADSRDGRHPGHRGCVGQARACERPRGRLHRS